VIGSSGINSKKAGAKMLILKSSLPGMELMSVGLLFTVKSGDLYASFCLFLNNSTVANLTYQKGYNLGLDNKSVL